MTARSLAILSMTVCFVGSLILGIYNRSMPLFLISLLVVFVICLVASEDETT